MTVVELFKQGSQEAFEKIYRQYYKKVYLFACKHTSNSTQAEDILHDAFLRLWEKRAHINPDVPLEAQLFVITRNLIINQYRREMRSREMNDQLSGAEMEITDEDTSSDDLLRALNAAIETLPPKRREIFKLSKLEGLTYEEIAEALQISKNTVESQMVKALRFLRKRVAHLPFF